MFKQFLLITALLIPLSLNAYDSLSQPIKEAHHPQKYNIVSDLPPVYISQKTESIGATWQNGNVWDKPLIELFYSLLTKKSDFFVVLDIGAQTGCFTLLSKYFPNSQWYAFEPIEEAAKELQINLFLNDIKNTSVYQLGMSSQPETKYLNLPLDTHWGLATLGENPLRFNQYESRKVELTCIDNFLFENEINQVDFIKIDTEGWELFVLQGAEKTIAEYRPIILMEMNEKNIKQCNIRKEDLFTFLKKYDYSWKYVTREDILCTPNDR